MKKWLYGLQNKMKIASTLTLLLVIILWNNISDRKRIEALENSFSSIYEDRLMVESFIFKLSVLIHDWESMVNSNSFTASSLKSHTAQIKGLVKDYENTKFTEKEAVVFKEFVTNLKSIYSLNSETDLDDAKTLTKDALIHLSELSSIQTMEGQRLIKESKDIFVNNKFASQLEIIALIILALFVQYLIFSSKSILEKIQQKPHLN
jgi:hypothetical protein